MGQGSEGVRVEVLGPIRVLDASGRDVTPDGTLQRRLLSLLVLRRSSLVSPDEAIEALWPASSPREPTAALQNHVSRLRRALPEGAIESVGAGYRLDRARISVDADELTTAVHSGAASADVVASILARWSGPAHPELDELDDGRAEAQRLEELRVRARELRAEARLAAGDADDLVAELAALADAEPLRERPRALLMAALAASGRRAEALRVYDDFRRLLGDELGIEPSPALLAQRDGLLRDGLLRDGPPSPSPSPSAPASSFSSSSVPPASSFATAALPRPAGSLVGRDELLADVIGLVAGHRLVTLVGPGGVGKSRLMLECGHRLAAADPERPVVLCELAGATRGNAIDLVAAALGIDARRDVPSAERVAGVLGAATVLVLLDNCEHVLDPAAELVERVLSTCPNVVVLATSQERLRLPGEQVRTVPPLGVGDEHAPAAQLFVDRARAVAPAFEPDDDARDRIDEIVRRLDGMPLAIELAAARLHTLDVTEVAAGLDQRFSLLSSGFRGSPRHASLAAAVSWSFDLLPDALQETFTDLSVFSGPFVAADAAAIGETDVVVATDALVQLAERSLVARAPGRRYVLLETLRAFGRDRLVSSGRAEAVTRRHAHRQVEWMEDAHRRLLETDDPVLAEVDLALPELRAALAWLLEHGDLDRATALVVAIFDYGYLRLRPDVLAWSEQVIAARPGDGGRGRASVWVVAAYAAWMGGDLAEAERRARSAWQAADGLGSEPPSMVASIQASIALFEGRLVEAAEWYRRSVELADDAGHRWLNHSAELLARGYAGDPSVAEAADAVLAELGDEVTGYAAHTWYCAGEAVLATDVELARARLSRALELAAATHATFVTGVAGASRASIDARLGDPEVAAADYRQLIDHWRRAGMWSTQWTVLRSIAGLLARLGRHHDAAVLEGAVRATEAGHRLFGADEAILAALSIELRRRLGDDGYEAALAIGRALDGDAAVEHALRSL